MFDPKIKIDKGLYDRLGQVAQAAGYATTDEFILHLLEKAVADVGDVEGEEEIKKRLQGLGYID